MERSVDCCPLCGEELDNDQCCNSQCPKCDWYDPPCLGCGFQKGWDHQNTQICKNMTCSLSPWYDPFIGPMPEYYSGIWDDPEYKRAYRERLWRCIDRLIWTNPGITFKEIKEIMGERMGAFGGKTGHRSFSSSMQSRVAQGMLVRYRRGWRFAKPPIRAYWQDGEILEIAGVSIE